MNSLDPGSASAADVFRILGEMEIETLTAILALGPTMEALEIVAAWRTGDNPPVDAESADKVLAEHIYALLASDRTGQDEPERPS